MSPRGWSGSVLQVKGRWVVQLKDAGGKWRQRSTGLAATPDNLAAARSILQGLRGAIPALPTKPKSRRAGRTDRATTRSTFKRRLGGDLACECCGWKPVPPLGRRAINAHHVVPISAGGTDAPENLIPLCPNCHALAHAIYGRAAAPSREALVEAVRAAVAAA